MAVDDIVAYTRRWLEFGYNAWLAERIPLRRELPDVRDRRCLNISYEHVMQGEPGVSLIVIFRNEQLAMLLRTLHSLRDRTDPEFVGELLVINDNSDMGIWTEELSRHAFDAYVWQHIRSSAKIFHMEEQMGLVRARRFAASMSEFEILVFLDAHVEVNEGWLEPLLEVIITDPYSVACPQLDLLDEQTLNYVRTVERRSLFDWTLRRREVPLLWHQLKELPHPFATPVLHTPVFAIDAEWFNYIAHFDMELNSPAAFELELSFKIWRSNNRILQVPCSRVGHLQPSDLNYMQRYGNLNQFAEQHFSSCKRLVETWLNVPKYKSVVYQYQPQIQQAHIGNVSEVNGTFEKVHFESFDWYLEHVATDLLHHFPLQPLIDFANGTLRPIQLPSHCLTGYLTTRLITLEACEPLLHATQNWTLTYMNDLRLGDNYCVEVQPNQVLALNPCHTLGGRQKWHFDIHDNCLVSNTHCLEFGAQMQLMVRTCNSINSQQMWFFEHINSLSQGPLQI
ncbi:putative polypeptide N-acetylgalactosaminyltransferase 12 [Drosophila innubila]|uniref:putative polypeptide N-acetylgalactosaminyltransferase 12 n=1 Tax=Drosophila innubila TaxID=198719 RepID=UPI00148B5D5F|nr:putative polypeptide N-acetylgalactosaminyltransferase 12 [Drosophila innubila]